MRFAKISEISAVLMVESTSYALAAHLSMTFVVGSLGGINCASGSIGSIQSQHIRQPYGIHHLSRRG